MMTKYHSRDYGNEKMKGDTMTNELTAEIVENQIQATEDVATLQVNRGVFDLPDPEEVARRAVQTKKMLAAACSVVSPQNITDFGGHPYFDNIASKRIANLFGLIVRQDEINGQVNYRKEVINDSTNHYIIKITGRVWHHQSPENYEIYEGSASSFDVFFRQWQIVEEKEENGEMKNVVVSAQTLPVSKVQEKATANLLQRCIKKKLGLDFSWEELEEAGIDRSKCKGFNFSGSKGADSAELIAQKQELWNKIVELCNGNVGLAKKTLQKHTSFNDFAGHTDINKVSEKQIVFLAKKVDAEYKKHLKALEEGQNGDN